MDEKFQEAFFQLEKIQRFIDFGRASEEGNIYGMVKASGIEPEYIKDMTMPELFEVMSVRISDLAKELGLENFNGESD